MAYIGTQPLAGQYRKLDDISSGFNGATTSFTTSVGGTNVTAGSPQQLLVSLGGVIQQPTTDYTVNTSTIIFTTAPASGLSFFAILMGDALNTSVPADGSITSAKLAGSLSVGLAAGSASTPSLFFTGDTNTGIYSPGADQVAISTNGSGRLFVNSSGSVGIGTSSPYSLGSLKQSLNTSAVGGFSIEASGSDTRLVNYYDSGQDVWILGATYGSTGAYKPLSFWTSDTRRVTIDTSGRVGIGTTSPSAPLHINGTANNTSITLSVGGVVTGYIGPAGFLGGSDSNMGYRVESGNNQVFYIGATERARLDSSGRLLVGTSSTTAVSTVTLQGNSTNSAADAIIRLARGTSSPASGDFLGSLIFGDSSWGEAAYITGHRDGGTWSGTSKPGRLVFSVTRDNEASPTEAMRINSDRDVFIGTTTVNPGIGNTTAGVMIRGGAGSNGNYIAVSRSGGTPLIVNRSTNDGVLVSLLQDGTEEGNISVSGTTVSYNGAHLSRWSQLPGNAERVEILRGTVLSNIDEMCEWGDEENEQLNRMKVSDVEGDKNVSGVFQAWDDDDDTYTNDFYCAMTGDFVIRIAAGTAVERGDLLMSAGDGTAKPQGDGYIQDKTIAKVTSTNVSCTYEDGSYCVPCVLMAC